MRKKTEKDMSKSTSSVDIDSDEMQYIYSKARTFMSDEQYYMFSYGILFVAVSIWCFSSNFKPVDTMAVFMIIGILLIIASLYQWWKRSEIRNKLLEKKWEAHGGIREEKKAYTSKWDRVKWFFTGRWLMKLHYREWRDFSRLLHNHPTVMDESDWRALEKMIKKDQKWETRMYRAGSYVGSIAVLGTILRLHGANKQSNTSGIILVLLYELVFALYCTWQLAWAENTRVIERCTSQAGQGILDASDVKVKINKTIADNFKSKTDGIYNANWLTMG
jgi:hypothetical protein